MRYLKSHTCQFYSLLLTSIMIFGCNDDEEDIGITGLSFDGNSIEVVEGFTINLDDEINIMGSDMPIWLKFLFHHS